MSDFSSMSFISKKTYQKKCKISFGFKGADKLHEKNDKFLKMTVLQLWNCWWLLMIWHAQAGGNLKTIVSVGTGHAELLMISVMKLNPISFFFLFFFSAPYSGNGVQNHDTIEDFSTSVKSLIYLCLHR